jgi:hypothetical protein
MKRTARSEAKYVRWNEMKGRNQQEAEPVETLGGVKGQSWVDKRRLRGAC